MRNQEGEKIEKTVIVSLIMITILFSLQGCKKEIPKEEALYQAKAFVDSTVKLYTSEKNETSIAYQNVTRASIRVLDVTKTYGSWNVLVHVESNATGELKKKGLMIPVDLYTGDIIVKDIQQFPV